MSKFPSLSSSKLIKLLIDNGCFFIRQGATDHAIYGRIVSEKKYAAPVQTGKKSLDPNYCKRIFKQLKFNNKEINKIIRKK